MRQEKKNLKGKRMDETQKQENAIVAQAMQVNGHGLVLHTLTDYKLAAEVFVASRLAPVTFKSVPEMVVAFTIGAELGLGPWQSLQQLHVDEKGRVAISGVAMGALIRKSKMSRWLSQEYEGEFEDDNFKAVVKSERTDSEPGHENRSEFSIADAKVAGLWKHDKKPTWNKYAKDMLMWRALGRHARMFYPDVLCGLYTNEELDHITPDAAYDTQTPPRDERKQVESQEPEEERNPLLEDAIATVFEKAEPLVGDIEKFADLCAEVCGGTAEDYMRYDEASGFRLDPTGFDAEKLDAINGHIENYLAGRQSFVDEATVEAAKSLKEAAAKSEELFNGQSKT